MFQLFLTRRAILLFLTAICSATEAECSLGGDPEFRSRVVARRFKNNKETNILFDNRKSFLLP